VQLDNKACTLALLAALPAARRVDQEEHRAFLERALRMREQLAADNPKRPDLRRYASMVAMNLALLLNEMGYKQEAADQLTQALANESRLTGTAAASLDGPRLRSDMEGTLGEILFKLGRLGEGLSHVRTALQITETAALLFPADADFAAKAMLWRDSLANIHEAALDPDRATAVRREAVAFANTVIAAAPTVHAHLDGLLAAHLTLAENLAGRGQAEAAAEFTAAIVVGRRLTTMVSPPDPSARRAECFRRLAMHDLSTDRPGDALGWLNLAVALIEGDPLWSDGPFRRDIETRRAQSLDCLGRPDEAAAARTRADKCLRQSSPAARTQGTTAKRSSVSGQ
jgi:tetratricopeptide (TPR) repeat protein